MIDETENEPVTITDGTRCTICAGSRFALVVSGKPAWRKLTVYRHGKAAYGPICDACWRKHSPWLVIPDRRCESCGQRLTAAYCGTMDRLRDIESIRVCAWCIARLLARAAVAIHGDIGLTARSSDFADHESRIAGHVLRVSRDLEIIEAEK